MIPRAWIIPLGAAGLGLVVGLGLGWNLWKPGPLRPETYALEIRQKDGSLILERRPQPLREAIRTVLAPSLPQGAVLERLVSATVRPWPTTLPEIPAATPGAIVCPPVKVNLALVRMPDQTRRVIASSPDGEVVGGMDIPIEPASVVRDLRNAVGMSFHGQRTYGLWAERDYGPIRIGADVAQQRVPGGGVTPFWGIRFGVRW